MSPREPAPSLGGGAYKKAVPTPLLNPGGRGRGFSAEPQSFGSVARLALLASRFHSNRTGVEMKCASADCALLVEGLWIPDVGEGA